MQAQGILLTMLGTGAPKMPQDIQVKDQAFGDIMTNLSGQRESRMDLNSGMDRNHLSVKKNDFNQSQKLSLNDSGSQPISEKVQDLTTDGLSVISEALTEAITDTVAGLVENLLKETLGLSDEDLTDIMEQLGIQTADLLLPVNLETLSFEGIDMDQLKSLVLEFHGIEDSSTILTNPQLEQELNTLAEGIQNILEGIQEEAPKVLQQILSAEPTPEEQPFVTGNMVIDKKLPNIEVKPDTTINQDDVTLNPAGMGEVGEEVQQDSGKGTEDGLSQKSEQTASSASVSKTELHKTELPVNTFVERLTNAIEKAVFSEAPASRPAESIVNQVINQIKVRVLPETTSMELALNPANLGRVNIAVTAANGVATATMTVQNQAAKEALESQLITLKETFAEKGIKVESVEVTVSDFGFKKEGDSRGNGNRAKQNSSKKMRLDSTDALDEDEQSFGTEASRQEDSIIDYTA